VTAQVFLHQKLVASLEQTELPASQIRSLLAQRVIGTTQ